MVRNRDPFSTALEDLRGRLTSGVYGGGAPVVILDEAKRLKLSTTPVREALAWLSGAGLVEHVSTGGYRASRIEAGIVRDRYRFRRDCLHLSLGNFTGPSTPTNPLTSPEGLFDWIVGRGGGPRAWRRLSQGRVSSGAAENGRTPSARGSDSRLCGHVAKPDRRKDRRPRRSGPGVPSRADRGRCRDRLRSGPAAARSGLRRCSPGMRTSI